MRCSNCSLLTVRAPFILSPATMCSQATQQTNTTLDPSSPLGKNAQTVILVQKHIINQQLLLLHDTMHVFATKLSKAKPGTTSLDSALIVTQTSQRATEPRVILCKRVLPPV
jgi:hypothetical protein